MLKWTKTEKLVKSDSRRASNFKSKSLALALLPTENQIFMACLDAHLYEIEYIYKTNTHMYGRWTNKTGTLKI
jgi:hypothetical protein